MTKPPTTMPDAVQTIGVCAIVFAFVAYVIQLFV